MQNPFEEILTKISLLDEKISQISGTPKTASAPDIINRAELCRRLKVSVPTAIRWEKKKKIPVFHLGSSPRYNWPSVVAALEEERY